MPGRRTRAIHGSVDRRSRLSVEEDKGVPGGGLRIVGDDVGEAPREGVHALLAVVHRHQYPPLLPLHSRHRPSRTRISGSSRRPGASSFMLGDNTRTNIYVGQKLSSSEFQRSMLCARSSKKIDREGLLIYKVVRSIFSFFKI